MDRLGALEKEVEKLKAAYAKHIAEAHNDFYAVAKEAPILIDPQPEAGFDSPANVGGE